jgi:hypothetical protein
MFECKTLLDYHNMYLKSEILLLADVLEIFRHLFYNIYGLDTVYYYSSPSLSWDSFLKHTTKEYKQNGNEYKI